MARELNQAERAALLLFAIGEDRAAAVLKHMEVKEVQTIGFAMARLTDISPVMVNDILGEIIVAVKNLTSLGVESDGYIRTILSNALGEEKASDIIQRIFLNVDNKGLDLLQIMDVKSLTDLIRLEHPQVGAILLSVMVSDKAAEVMLRLPENLRSDLVIRIANMQGVQPGAMRELGNIMQKQLNGSEAGKARTLGGIDTAANILNFMEFSARNLVLDEVHESNAQLASIIQEKMFVFEDLISLSGNAWQTVLREVQTEQLLLALRGATDNLKEKIFSHMSKRAADILRDDLEASPPAKLKDVETAQKEIMSIVKQLEDSGEIQIGNANDALI
ncbi:MAG: flagellar motor switch protein FliG [Methylococcales bacterium]|nr:flagellar motor switch protein FliG [Methylococcales bacterium]